MKYSPVILLLFLFSNCIPSKRISRDIELVLNDVRLNNAISSKQFTFSLKNDPYFSEHEEELDLLDEIRLEVRVPENQSSLLKLGFHISKEPKDTLTETRKIADLNLENGADLPDLTELKIFNVSVLRSFLLGEQFTFYVSGQAENLDVNLAEIRLVVTAKFIE